MSEQTLTAIIQLMGMVLGTESVSVEDKKTANNILAKALALIEKSVSIVYNREITKLTIA